MGQETSCCTQSSTEQGMERIFDNNNYISREARQNLGPEYESIIPSRKSKLIKLHKIACESGNQNGRFGAIHSRNMSSVSQKLCEANLQRAGDQNNIQQTQNLQGNMNRNNGYLSTGDTSKAYLTSPSSYDIDQFNQVSAPHKLNVAAVNPDKIYTVRETYLDGSTYEGEKRNEFRHGYGVFVFSNAACYKGSWAQDKMNGRGLLYYSSGQLAYQGQFSENKFEGFGYLNNEFVDYSLRDNDDKYYYDFNTIENKWIKYEGEFYNDSKNGRGRLYFSNGDFIQADFFDDKINGDCILYKSNNTNIKGHWRENKLIKLNY